jgi:hypothetical protein
MEMGVVWWNGEGSRIEWGEILWSREWGGM